MDIISVIQESFWLKVFIAQAVIGILGVEYCLAKNSRAFYHDEERDSEFPAFRRLDVKNWSRWTLYPQAILLLAPRLVMVFGALTALGVTLRLIYCGKAWNKPLTGVRNFLFRWTYAFYLKIIIISFGYIHLPTQNHEVDYSYYLGPDYKKQYKAPKRISTIISNHIGFMDVLVLLNSPIFPSFTPAHFVKNFPIGAFFVETLQSIYLNRELPLNERDKLVDEIVQRQEQIETSDAHLPPLAIFAEGSVTNGKYLSEFKRGGFIALKTVQPIFLKYDWNQISPSYDVCRGIDLGFFMAMSIIPSTATINVLPPFQPTEYLFKTHTTEKRQKKWEVYAWAVHEIIKKQGGFAGTSYQPLRDKLNYQKFLWKTEDYVAVNGKTFYIDGTRTTKVD